MSNFLPYELLTSYVPMILPPTRSGHALPVYGMVRLGIHQPAFPLQTKRMHGSFFQGVPSLSRKVISGTVYLPGLHAMISATKGRDVIELKYTPNYS